MSQSERVALYATLNEDENVSQTYGAINYSSVRLMELPPAILELVESPDAPPLTIKSSPNGAAILNTPSKSFLLRAVDQSNSLMLFSPTDTDGFQLVHTAKQYLEIVPNPHRIKLDHLIPVWTGETMDIDGVNRITMDALRRSIAASDSEIDSALNASLAVEIDGYVYQMSPVYATHLLDLITSTATADSIPITAISLNDLLRSLDSHDERPECIEAILRNFSDSSHEPYSLNQTKVTRWYGLRTLSNRVGSISTTAFLNEWQSSLPPSIDHPISIEMLKGNYYNPSPTTIHYLPSAELSSVAEDRFAQLFGIKEKWTMNEILPFLEGCVERGEGWEKKAERECQKWARVRSGFVTRR